MQAIEAKLVRAHELLEALKFEVHAFEQKMPSPRIEKGYKPGTPNYAFYSRLEVTVPLRFAVLTGEIIHQLRSSLDHLIAHLVVSEGAELTRSHQFPICGSEESFRSQLSRGCLSSVPDSARGVIESVQPYNAQDPEVSVLLAVQELNNADKHRLLAVVAASTRIGNEVRVSCGEAATITGMSPPHLALANGSEFFAIDLLRPYKETNVEIDFETRLALQRPVHLSWPFELAPLIPVLEQCESAVVHTISNCLKS